MCLVLTSKLITLIPCFQKESISGMWHVSFQADYPNIAKVTFSLLWVQGHPQVENLTQTSTLQTSDDEEGE